MTQLRQGDVFLQEIKALPKKAKKVKTRIMAKGETTGYRHLLEKGADVYSIKGTFYIKTPAYSIKLQHKNINKTIAPEHKEIVLEPQKVYKVKIAREYDPYKKIAREIED